MNKQRKEHIAITVAISVIIVFLSVFAFYKSWLRLFETFKDFGCSVTYYFCKLFEIKTSVIPSVTEYSKVFAWNGFLPDSSEKANGYAKDFFALFFSAENFNLWLNGVTDGLYIFLKILVLSLPCIVLIVIVSQKMRQKRNNDYNADTKPLKTYKAVENKVFVPVIRFVKVYMDFLKENIKVVYAWLILIAVMLNLASVFVAFFSYYFYLAVSFDVGNLWVQFSKLIIDLQVVMKAIPLIGWLVIAYVLFNRWRKNYAMRRLRHYEARNCGFINELPIVSMTCGSMGKKKTTVITDMALSQEVMFRQKAFELLQKNDMKFPNFPWISFEMDMRNCMEHGTVYNLATVKAWVEKKRKRFEKHKNSELQLYGYDVGRYALTYKDGLKTYDIFDVLSTYAQAYAKELYIDGKLVTSVEITSATINAYAFCDYDALTSVTIGKNVTSIGDSAFSGCSSLTSVTIGGGVTSIGNSAFSRCSGLTAVTIPDSVNSIGDGAFGACSGLTSVIIPDSVNSIGRIAFYGCSSLTSVTIGEGVTSIGEDVFGRCDNLKSVYYQGTASEWGKISINDYNYYLTSATIYYYIEKETDVPTDGGNYWHYVDCVAIPWEN